MGGLCFGCFWFAVSVLNFVDLGCDFGFESMCFLFELLVVGLVCCCGCFLSVFCWIVVFAVAFVWVGI